MEAILYLRARPVKVAELADCAGCSREAAEAALLELMAEYVQRDSALEIVETKAGYSLQLRDRFLPLIERLVPTDLGVGALRTLAVIALKGPLTMAELVDLRGSGVYQRVPELVERGLVKKRRLGRSSSLQVTEKFHHYFQLHESADGEQLELVLKALRSTLNGGRDDDGEDDDEQEAGDRPAELPDPEAMT